MIMKIIITLFIGSIGGYMGLRMKVPAGALIGSMIAVACYNIFTNKGYIPSNFKIFAQIAVGAMIGLNFTLVSIKEFKSIFFPALLLIVGLTVFSLFLGYIVSKVTGLDLMTALFSCLPGGLTDMALISEAYNADVPKVVAMHLARLITVIAFLPILIRVIFKYLVRS